MNNNNDDDNVTDNKKGPDEVNALGGGDGRSGSGSGIISRQQEEATTAKTVSTAAFRNEEVIIPLNDSPAALHARHTGKGRQRQEQEQEQDGGRFRGKAREGTTRGALGVTPDAKTKRTARSSTRTDNAENDISGQHLSPPNGKGTSKSPPSGKKRSHREISKTQTPATRRLKASKDDQKNDGNRGGDDDNVDIQAKTKKRRGIKKILTPKTETDRQNQFWTNKIEQLRQFKNRHGHARVRRETHPALFGWLRNQKWRYYYQSLLLSSSDDSNNNSDNKSESKSERGWSGGQEGAGGGDGDETKPGFLTTERIRQLQDLGVELSSSSPSSKVKKNNNDGCDDDDDDEDYNDYDNDNDEEEEEGNDNESVSSCTKNNTKEGPSAAAPPPPPCPCHQNNNSGMEMELQTWKNRCRELKQFKERFGHVRVPKQTKPILHFWFVNQARRYRLFVKKKRRQQQQQKQQKQKQKGGNDKLSLSYFLSEECIEQLEDVAGVEYLTTVRLSDDEVKSDSDAADDDDSDADDDDDSDAMVSEEEEKKEKEKESNEPVASTHTPTISRRYTTRSVSRRNKFLDAASTRTAATKTKTKTKSTKTTTTVTTATVAKTPTVSNRSKGCSKKQHAAWMKKYEELKAYRAKHGDCKVSIINGKENRTLALWVVRQRSLYKARKEQDKTVDGDDDKEEEDGMTDERIRLLNDIGFQWEVLSNRVTRAWDERFAELEEYKSQHGHCNVPQNHNRKTTKLGAWVNGVRRSHKRKRLRKEQREALERIGFEFSLRVRRAGRRRRRRSDEGDAPSSPSKTLGNDEKWQIKYRQLKEYKAQFGHCRVPVTRPGGLGKWVRHQRERYQRKKEKNGKHGGLEDDRIRLLDDIGFEWTGVRRFAPWERRFEELRDLKERYGTVTASRKLDYGLYQWYHKQIHKVRLLREGKESTLTEDLAKRIEELCFDSCPQRLDEDDGAPVDLGESLPNATPTTGVERGKSKPKDTDEGKNGRAAGTGGRRKLGVKWLKGYKELQAYKAQHGHCNVERSSDLGRWVRKNRRDYQRRQKGEKSPMSEERIRLLKAIDFKWKLPESMRKVGGPKDHVGWMNKYEELKAFRAEHGHCNVNVNA